MIYNNNLYSNNTEQRYKSSHTRKRGGGTPSFYLSAILFLLNHIRRDSHGTYNPFELLSLTFSELLQKQERWERESNPQVVLWTPSPIISRLHLSRVRSHHIIATPLPGLEPGAFHLVGGCSIRLSYRGVILKSPETNTKHSFWAFAFYNLNFTKKFLKRYKLSTPFFFPPLLLLECIIDSVISQVSISRSSNFHIWIYQLPRENNDFPIATIAHRACKRRHYKWDNVIPRAKEHNCWDSIKANKKFNKVFWSLQFWRFANIFQAISESLFRRFNSSDINHRRSSCNGFPQNGCDYLSNVRAFVIKQVLFCRNAFSFFKPFRNFKVLNFMFTRATKPFVFNNYMKMHMIASTTTRDLYNPQTSEQSFLNIGPTSKIHKMIYEGTNDLTI